MPRPHRQIPERLYLLQADSAGLERVRHGAPDPWAYDYYGYKAYNGKGVLVQYGFGTADYQTDVYVNKAVDFLAAATAVTTAVVFVGVVSGAPQQRRYRCPGLPQRCGMRAAIAVWCSHGPFPEIRRECKRQAC